MHPGPPACTKGLRSVESLFGMSGSPGDPSMQQIENLAPHVNELTRALQNRVDPASLEDELRRYLEYGVPLAQAKHVS